MQTRIYICEYHFGNATNNKDISFHETKEQAIDTAIGLLSSGKYSLGDDPETIDDMRNDLTTKGYYTDGNTSYGEIGLTFAKIFSAYSDIYKLKVY